MHTTRGLACIPPAPQWIRSPLDHQLTASPGCASHHAAVPRAENYGYFVEAVRPLLPYVASLEAYTLTAEARLVGRWVGKGVLGELHLVSTPLSAIASTT